jgi:type IV pilus assembly protein PilC
MTEPTQRILSFAYRAQTADGSPLSGVIESTDADAARWRLQGIGLRVLELEPVVTLTPAPRPLRGEDFAAFNQQLAQLAAAGLPIERGLRLIAEDMASGRMAESVRRVAAALESGKTLGEAFAEQSAGFPPLYGELLEIGAKTGDLGGVLLGLGRHLEMVQRLRDAMWRAASYPLMVLAGLAILLSGIGWFVAPPFEAIYSEYDSDLPTPTKYVFALGHWMPVIALVAAGLFAVAMAVWTGTKLNRHIRGLVGEVVLRLPLIGPVLRRGVAARWCGVTGLAVGAGIDLPRAMGMAAGAIGLASVEADTRRLIEAVSNGRPMAEGPALGVLPATVAVTMDFAARRGDLATALEMLTGLYERQAEHRMARAVAVIQPALLLVVALLVGIVILAMFLPMIHYPHVTSG